MGNDARRKERQRKKRQEKRASIRRAQSGSPYHRLALPGSEFVACYINEDWQDKGIASVTVLKRAPGGGLALGAYLIDTWCLGLKDVWGRLDISQLEFEDHIEHAKAHLALVRIAPEQARQLVAGAIRFAKQNGFRLPPKYERWTALLGTAGEVATADLSPFGIEGGKLRYVGSTEDLRDRLIGCRLEDFLARKDVEYIAGPPMGYDDDEFDDEFEDGSDPVDIVEEVANRLKNAALDRIREWCFAKGVPPHPRLKDAVGATFMALLQTPALDDPDSIAQASDNLRTLASLEADDASFAEAMELVRQFMGELKSPDAFMKALGVEDLFKNG
jgi:hypothetical protein